ncbi:MAG: NAD-dependent epimerase/dehydratase family protein, partial [Atopobiaceae bacterium]|nr:NAD-dependent epimerase/dehydratase family protein [Atopobiaceae bacterium]
SATKRLVEGGTIQLFNEGECWRDFTYIDDIVEGIVRVMGGAPIRKTGEDGLPIAPYALYNIGGGHPERVLEVIDTLQGELVRAGLLPSGYDFDAHRELVGMQPGDVELTCADTQGLLDDYGFSPTTRIADGLRSFVDWYASYIGADDGSKDR